MLTIRFSRKGKKNQPFFKVVVVDKRRSAKGGRVIEFLGYVNPLTKKKSLEKERILHWISKGAQPSDTVHNLLITEKIIEGKKIPVAKVKKKAGAEASAPAGQGAPAAPAAQSAPDVSAEAPAKVEAPKVDLSADVPAEASAQEGASGKAEAQKEAEKAPATADGGVPSESEKKLAEPEQK